MIKKILVPTDFSEHAENALKVAAELARKNEAEIYLLHMLELPLHLANEGGGGQLPEALFFMKLAHQKFEKFMDKEYMEDLTVYETVELHTTHEGIIDSVEKNNIDLVVMGSEGATGLKEMFIGSNTEKVVRHSKVPVLVIKRKMDGFSVKNFVFASDFSEECKGPFKKAVEIAQAFDAKLNLLMVNTANKFISTAQAEGKMNGFIRDFDLSDYSLNIYNDDTIEHGIMNFSKSIDADLIGLSTHGRKGLAHFFNGSLSEDLVNHALRPVITFRI